VWGEFFTPVQTGPGAHLAFCVTCTGSLFLGAKQAGRGVDHPTPSSAEGKERGEVYLYFPRRP